MKRIALPIVVLIPLLWLHHFSLPQVAALAMTLLMALAGKVFCRNTVTPAFATLFLLQLYLPLHNILAVKPNVVLLTGIVVLIAVHLAGRGKEPASCCTAPRFLAAVTPLVLGGGIVLALYFSKFDLPEAFIPLEGWLVAAGISLLWLAGIHWLSRSTECLSSLFRLSFGTMGVLILALLFRVASIQWEVRGDGEKWQQLVNRAERLGWQSLDLSVREKALASGISRDDWVRFAKGSVEDPSEEIEGIPLSWRILARGGEAFTEEAPLTADDSAVGMCINGKLAEIHVLSAKGRLLRISDDREDLTIESGSGPFVHCAQATDLTRWQRREILILEATGRLLAFDPNENTTTEVCPSPYAEKPPIFRRVCIDPATGNPWGLDLYGNLYHGPSSTGWEIDKRFSEVCRRGEIDYDVARDITISGGGTISLLTCDGEIWSSSLGSSEVKGPVRETHYWPDHAVGQSIQSHTGAHSLVDRYGGVYLSPYPRGRDFESFSGSHLFPRSLPLKEEYLQAGDGVVDHAYMTDERWIYLLTGRGRILTNCRWSEIWAY